MVEDNFDIGKVNIYKNFEIKLLLDYFVEFK